VTWGSAVDRHRDELRSQARGGAQRPACDGGGSRPGTGAMDVNRLPVIQAACPACGEVSLSPRQLRMHLPLWGGDWTYRFCCPGCGGEVTRQLTDRTLRLLSSAAVEADFGLDGDGPGPEAPEPHPPPAIRAVAAKLLASKLDLTAVFGAKCPRARPAQPQPTMDSPSQSCTPDCPRRRNASATAS
jgi:predicted RNA-binding Zn-ribbon protein involved in translation (DUF1610 family)